MKKFETITQQVYLDQHNIFKTSSAFKRQYNQYKNPKTFGLQKKHFLNSKVIDLGCGSTGYLLKAMQTLKCQSVTCCDLGSKYIYELKKFEKKNLKKNFLIFKSQNISKKLQFKNNSFDIVFLNGVIQHLGKLSDVKKSLTEAERICKKGGYIWITGGLERRNSVIDEYVKPSFREAYRKNLNFRKLIDSFDKKTILYFLNFFKKKLSSSDYKKIKKFIDNYINLDTITFFKNMLQVPKQLQLEISFNFIKKTLKRCKIKKTPPLKYKRKDFRKFLQPFHSNDEKISKIFYNKHLHVLANKIK